MFIIPLSQSAGNANLFSSASCAAGVSLFYMYSIDTCVMIFQHIAWMMLAFQGYRDREWVRVLWVFVSHMACSYTTLMNANVTSVSGGCAWVVVLLSVSTGVSFAWLLTLSDRRVSFVDENNSNPSDAAVTKE